MPEDPDFAKFMNMPPFDAYFTPQMRGIFGGVLRKYVQSLDFIKTFMPYDLTETETTYIVEMPLPGFLPNQIHISLSGTNTIHIEAETEEKSHETGTPNSSSHTQNHGGQCKINWSQVFWRRPIHVEIPIEQPVDPDLVKAKLEKGILTVTFQKITPAASDE